MSLLMCDVMCTRINFGDPPSATNSGGVMRKVFHFWRECFAILLTVLVSSAANSQQTNGCGTGWNRYLVPDRLKVVGCNFRPACDAHDVCYGACSGFAPGSAPKQCEYLRCEQRGDLFGKPVCESVAFRENRIAAEDRRAQCDAAFMVDITRTNPGNARCTLYSGLYPFVVRVLGSKNFLGMDATEQITMSEADKTRYANAINSLLETWPEDRLVALAQQIRDGTAGVDLTKPIYFDKQRGLRNRQPSAR